MERPQFRDTWYLKWPWAMLWFYREERKRGRTIVVAWKIAWQAWAEDA